MIDKIEARAAAVSGEIRSCIRQSVMALEEKENDLLKQVDSRF